jgi:hypothetical protein
MALAALSGDEQCIIFSQLCNVLDTRIAVAFSSTSSELWALTQAQRQQLRADHEAAAALCLKMGLRSCKELREAKVVGCLRKGLSADDLATLGTLGSVLPSLEVLRLCEPAAGPDGVPRLAERLGAGALPAVTSLTNLLTNLLTHSPTNQPTARTHHSLTHLRTSQLTGAWLHRARRSLTSLLTTHQLTYYSPAY